MKLQAKLNLVSLFILLLDGVLNVSMGTYVITSILNKLNQNVLKTELRNRVAAISEVYRILKDSGLDGVPMYVSSAQQDIFDDIKRYNYGTTGGAFIVGPEKTIISQSAKNAGTTLVTNAELLKEMVANKSGATHFKQGQTEYLSSYETFPEWGWVVSLFVTSNEVLETRDQYLKNVSIIAVMVLLLNVFVLRSFGRRLTKKIAISLEVLRRVETNDLDARIPSVVEVDEIDSLQVGINSMISVIQTRNNELTTLNQDLENRVQSRTAELREAQAKALDNAHSAGMAEIAIGVLHNVGNIVNSVNISANEMVDVLKKSDIEKLSKANQLLQTGQLSQDEAGRDLIRYYVKLEESFRSGNALLSEELLRLLDQVRLIKDVVQSQQKYAKTGLHMEQVSIENVLEEFLRMESKNLEINNVKVIKKYTAVPPIKVQRVKVDHVLVNLVKNAIEAMEKLSDDRKNITFEIGQNADGTVFLKVTDSGPGIDPVNIAKIFNLGFTTKDYGQGIGLHFCANALTEMGGKLSAVNAEKGATFIAVFQTT